MLLHTGTYAFHNILPKGIDGFVSCRKLQITAQSRNTGAATMLGMLALTGVVGDVALPKTKTAL